MANEETAGREWWAAGARSNDADPRGADSPGRPLLQAIAAARRSLAHEVELDAAVESFLSVEEQSAENLDRVVVDLRSFENNSPQRTRHRVIGQHPAGRAPFEEADPASGSPGRAETWLTIEPPPALGPLAPAHPAPPAAPAWGSLWKQSAQGWVRDEQGRLVWRPIVTTTIGVPNWEIDTNLGLVTGESACALKMEGLGALVESADGNAMVRSQLEGDREQAIGDLVDAAVTRGAHAVVGVQLSYTFLVECLVVTATGTAVTLKPHNA